MSKLLIVEDDRILRETLATFLRKNGYEVEIIINFDHTLKQILDIKVDLILLDINLPNIDGEFLCREIRKNSDVPIIMVTSRDNELDELLSINFGADDYIVKPFNPQILLARIESILKRFYHNNPIIIPYQNLRLNVSKSIIEYENEVMELSKNEMKIFYFLLKNRSKIVSREDIMNYLWDTEEFVNDNTLTVNINRLRNKLMEIGFEDVIETKRGQGYIIQ